MQGDLRSCNLAWGAGIAASEVVAASVAWAVVARVAEAESVAVAAVAAVAAAVESVAAAVVAAVAAVATIVENPLRTENEYDRYVTKNNTMTSKNQTVARR